jgi:GH24 family phage-related lysozyme (muramidase)
MVYSIRFKLDTWLKQSTAQGASLPEAHRQLINARTVLPISDFLREGNHLKITLGKNEQNQQLSYKGRNTWYVYEPAVEILQDGRVINLETLKPIEPAYILRVLLDTFLKLSTAQSSTLPDEQKQFVRSGTTLPISSFAPAGKYHVKVALGLDERGKQVILKGYNTWYAYAPAIEVLRDGIAVDIPSPPPEGPTYSLKINLDTFLKRTTAQSSTLPDEQKQLVKAGTVFPLSSFQAVGNFHIAVALGLDERGKQISFKGYNTWYVYQPAVDILKDGEAIDLFPPSPPDETDFTVKFTTDTFLKLNTEQSSSLPDDQKQFIEGGTILPLSSFVFEGDHIKIAFGKDIQGNQVHFKGRNTWYVYEPAAQILQDGEPISLSELSATRQINDKGLRILKSFEGLRLEAYLDPVGVWTIGYGTTSGVRSGMVITATEAEDLLRQDLRRFEAAVAENVKVSINDDQFSALVSFTYNVGEGALSSSTLLRLLNQGNIQGAADQFPRWNKAGGRVLAGLTRRRNAERALFLGEDFTRFL